jgi:hypothetical protein
MQRRDGGWLSYKLWCTVNIRRDRWDEMTKRLQLLASELEHKPSTSVRFHRAAQRHPGEAHPCCRGVEMAVACAIESGNSSEACLVVVHIVDVLRERREQPSR